MSWFDILKNQSLATSQLGSTMNWEEEEVPDEEEEDNDCIKKLMEIYERANSQKISNKYNTYRTPAIEINISLEKDFKISEKKACEVLDKFRNLRTGFSVRAAVFGGDDFSMFKDYQRSDGDEDRYTLLEIRQSYKTKYFINVAYRQNPNDEKDEAIELEYINICKKIFGEYYNSTYEEVFG